MQLAKTWQKYTWLQTYKAKYTKQDNLTMITHQIAIVKADY